MERIRTRAEGAAPRPSRRGPATGDDHRVGRRDRLSPTCPLDRTRRPHGTWMMRGANRKDLTLYLETFAHTVAVMQTREGIERVARECAEDLAADGVVYAEVRFAPELHTEQGLVPRRRDRGGARRVRRRAPTGPSSRSAPSARRCATMDNSPSRSPRPPCAGGTKGVVAFDIAGPEDGYPPDDHHPRLPVLPEGELPHHRSTPVRPTVPARSGRRCSSAVPSASGTASASSRTWSTTTPTVSRELSRLAHFLRDRRIPLEVCPDVQRQHRRGRATSATTPSPN